VLRLLHPLVPGDASKTNLQDVQAGADRSLSKTLFSFGPFRLLAQFQQQLNLRNTLGGGFGPIRDP